MNEWETSNTGSMVGHRASRVAALCQYLNANFEAKIRKSGLLTRWFCFQGSVLIFQAYAFEIYTRSQSRFFFFRGSYVGRRLGVTLQQLWLVFRRRNTCKVKTTPWKKYGQTNVPRNDTIKQQLKLHSCCHQAGRSVKNYEDTIGSISGSCRQKLPDTFLSPFLVFTDIPSTHPIDIRKLVLNDNSTPG